MANKPPASHVVRAASLAHELFAPKEDAPATGSAFKNVTLSVPLGMLATLDLLARRSGQSRSATAAQLMECGFGLVMQQLTPSKRSALAQELSAAHVDLAGYQVPADGSATLVAVEG